VKVDDRVTGSNTVYVTHSWQVTLHNYKDFVVVVSGDVQYRDAQGFILERSPILNFAIPAMSDGTIRGETLIATGKAAQVKTVNAELKRSPY
jgi:hypothetical protein